MKNADFKHAKMKKKQTKNFSTELVIDRPGGIVNYLISGGGTIIYVPDGLNIQQRLKKKKENILRIGT